MDKKVKKIKRNGIYYYCTPSSEKITELTSDECLAYFDKLESNSYFNDFNDYLKHTTKMHYDVINESNWKLSKCSCWWCKYFKCKHMIGICARLKYFEFETVHKQIPIGNTSSCPGRPKLTKKALQLQKEEYLKSDEEEDEYEQLQQKKNQKQVKKRKKNDSTSSSDDELYAKFITSLNEVSTQNLSKLPVLPLDEVDSFIQQKNKNKKCKLMKEDSFSDESESVACTSSAANHKKQLQLKQVYRLVAL